MRRDQRGASLVVVLALIAFLAIMLPAILGIALTGSKVTQSAIDDRHAQYVANSALDAAIQQGRQDWVGRPGTSCPEQTLEMEGLHASVTCEYTTRWCDLDRSIVYSAVVTDPSAPSVQLVRANAAVVFKSDPLAAAPVPQVYRWDPDATAKLSTSTTVACPGGGPGPTVPPVTTTTSTTTTTTTTTTVPVGPMLVSLGPVTAQSGWSAQGVITVQTASGAPVAGATVTVQIYSRTNGQANFPTTPSETRQFVTESTGTVVASPSGNFANGVRELRFQITAVTHPTGSWAGAPGGVISPGGQLTRTACRPGATCP